MNKTRLSVTKKSQQLPNLPNYYNFSSAINLRFFSRGLLRLKLPFVERIDHGSGLNRIESGKGWLSDKVARGKVTRGEIRVSLHLFYF